MDLDTLIITWFYWIDEGVQELVAGQRLRQRGPAPALADSEVLTMEVVGEYLGLDQDSALFTSFQRHWSHFFPRLRHLHRTTFIARPSSVRPPTGAGSKSKSGSGCASVCRTTQHWRSSRALPSPSAS